MNLGSNSGNGAVESTDASAPLSPYNGIKLFNCSFLNINTKDRPTITIPKPYPNFILSDCIFKDISSNLASTLAGACCCSMGSSDNKPGNFNISGNRFVDVKANKSAMYIVGTFSSFIFSNNHFINVSSTNEGGVYFYF
jgi:hypothetical protein